VPSGPGSHKFTVPADRQGRVQTTEVREQQFWTKQSRPCGEARRRAIAAPWPVFRPFDQAGANRVQDDIPAGGQEVAVRLDDLSAEAPLEHVSNPVVPLVPPLRVGGVYLFHHPRHIGARRRCDEVKVIVHQAVGMARHAEPIGRVREDAQEPPTISVVFEDDHARVSARGDVVRKPGRLEPERPCHR